MNENEYPTVMEGRIVDGQLQITVHNIFTGSVMDVKRFHRREM